MKPFGGKYLELLKCKTWSSVDLIEKGVRGLLVPRPEMMKLHNAALLMDSAFISEFIGCLRSIMQLSKSNHPRRIYF